MSIPTAIKFLISELAHREFWLLILAGVTATLMMLWRNGLRDNIFNRAESFKWMHRGR